MNKKKTQRDPEAVSFAQARDEMFSHILRCGVIDALPEHQKDWFDDTMLYLISGELRLRDRLVLDHCVVKNRRPRAGIPQAAPESPSWSSALGPSHRSS